MSRPGGTIFLLELKMVTKNKTFTEEKLHLCPSWWLCGGKSFGHALQCEAPCWNIEIFMHKASWNSFVPSLEGRCFTSGPWLRAIDCLLASAVGLVSVCFKVRTSLKCWPLRTAGAGVPLAGTNEKPTSRSQSQLLSSSIPSKNRRGWIFSPESPFWDWTLNPVLYWNHWFSYCHLNSDKSHCFWKTWAQENCSFPSFLIKNNT